MLLSLNRQRFFIRRRCFLLICLVSAITTFLVLIVYDNYKLRRINRSEQNHNRIYQYEIKQNLLNQPNERDIKEAVIAQQALTASLSESLQLESNLSKHVEKHSLNDQWNANEKAFGEECNDFLKAFKPDVDSNLIYPTLEFDGDWIEHRHFWDLSFEKRYQKMRNETAFPLKVFVIPHSHTDPGWLKTFEEYFYKQVRNIIDDSIDKLEEFPTMKFQLSEISYLSKWYKYAHPTRREALKKLVKDGRLEIVTGGYVMSDEACVNLYSLIDQLVEGHEWTKRYLDVIPKSSWSIDPFGHGSTFPYILKSSGLNGMVIQRIHYAWKRYFGMNRNGDFNWVQRWDSDQSNQILTHNAPFDIYSIKHSCGPEPSICLNFDFYEVDGEFRENSGIMRPINKDNIKMKSELLLEQYRKTASLNPHNIALIALGNDFAYQTEVEWNQQYFNYQKMFDFINENENTYNAQVQFGTITEYFDAIKSRSKTFPTFSGDFFVYSDIFSDGRAAYWSGYFSTRPYWKKFYRETENEMRSAEILFSYANALAKQKSKQSYIQLLNHEYEKLIVGRQWLALFAHHDAATGTSKEAVMEDYGKKLYKAKTLAIGIQRLAAKTILFSENTVVRKKLELSSDTEQTDFGSVPEKIRIDFTNENQIKEIIIFNNLGWRRSYVVKILVPTPHVQVEGPSGDHVTSQLNPYVDFSSFPKLLVSSVAFELIFIADLPSLSLTTYKVKICQPMNAALCALPSTIICEKCSILDESFFNISLLKQEENFKVSNSKIEVSFDRKLGYPVKVTSKKPTKATLDLKVSFGVYKSIKRQSGAYLLKLNTKNPQFFPESKEENPNVIAVSGVVVSEVISIMKVIGTTFTILKGIENRGADLEAAIFMQTMVNFELRRGEMFMRIDSDLDTRKIRGQEEEAVPSFFTDSNGFTMEKRYKVSNAPIETNFYPVNTLTYLEDEKQKLRLSLIVDRAHGFSSLEKGRLEGLIERRTIYDDGRGLGEGVTDNKETISNYILLLENIGQSSLPEKSAIHLGLTEDEDNLRYERSLLPTISSHHLVQSLSYPPSIFFVNYPKYTFTTEDPTLKFKRRSSLQNSDPPRPFQWNQNFSFLSKELPSDTHLINFRTISEHENVNVSSDIPSEKSLLILEKFGYLCNSQSNDKNNYFPNPNANSYSTGNIFYKNTTFNDLKLKIINETSLTGIDQSSYRTINSFDDIILKPFNIKSFILKF